MQTLLHSLLSIEITCGDMAHARMTLESASMRRDCSARLLLLQPEKRERALHQADGGGDVVRDPAQQSTCRCNFGDNRRGRGTQAWLDDGASAG
jgi:hypothetical protein